MRSLSQTFFLLLMLSLFCSSCATIFNGRKQTVVIRSKPAGALVSVDGKPMGTTPLVIKESPKKPLKIVFESPGYEARTYILKNKFQWAWFILDAPLTYGPLCIPFGIDVLTMAPYRFTEKEVMMNFDSVYTPPPVEEIVPTNVPVHIQRERIVLNREEVIAKEEAKRRERILLRDERIRYERLLDSTHSANRRQRVDSSRVRNYRLATNYKNVLSLQLLGLFVGETDLSYYRNVYKGLSLGIEVGYKAPDNSKSSYGNNDKLDINGPVQAIMHMPFTESYYLGLATKIPVLDFGRGWYYVSFVSFVRNSSFDHKMITWQNQTDYEQVTNYKDSVGVHQNSVGLKILMGIKPIIQLAGKKALEFDLYTGISFRNVKTEIFHYLKTSTITTYNSPTIVNYNNEPENYTQFIPTFQVGFRVGLRF